jgi:hypothetical protein
LGIRAMLEGLQAKGWEPILDAGKPIGLKRDGASVSLEPGGQFELSGAPVADLHATRVELAAHLREVHEVAGPLGLGFAPLGFHPLARREDMPWMPKGRYAIMRTYMPKVGGMGLDMMLRTCTVQVNLDFGDEADMVEKLRVGLALQPLATALFANSPFLEGRPSGFLSLRGRVWTDTDPDRTGIPRRCSSRASASSASCSSCSTCRCTSSCARGAGSTPPACPSATSWRAARWRATARRWATGRTTSPPSSPMCASSASSRCAAPMRAARRCCGRCPRCGSGCSMTTRRRRPPPR